ncbi:MAG: alcohol dehydrogenase [Verrucomicrobia bacterium]|nr:alcohol dehydrogenase [Verrucomicrobiota bacterium]
MKTWLRIPNELKCLHARLLRIEVAWLTGLLAGWSVCSAEDWPQFRGPRTDGTSTERIATEWPAAGPPVLWRVSLTDGFGGFAVSGGRAFTLIKRDVSGQAREVCLALDADSGAELWARPVGTASYTSGASGPGAGSDGPRSTPTVRDGRVFLVASRLEVYSLRAEDGAVVWTRNLQSLYSGRLPDWQSAASPLIVGDLLLMNCGSSNNSIVALRTGDGSLAWRSQAESATYATPVLATLHGRQQVIFSTTRNLLALAPEDGRLLWRYGFGSVWSAATPVVAEDLDLVFSTVGYGVGAMAVKVSESGNALVASPVYTSAKRSLESHWMTPVYRQGHLYGMFGHADYNRAPLRCVDPVTGTVKWSVDDFGQGALLLLGDKLLVLTENGDLSTVEATPAAYRPVSRFKALSGKCWNAPAISHGRIYARSTRQAVAFDVALPPPPPLRLQAPVLRPDRVLELAVASADGQPIAAERLSGIQVRTSPDLASPLSQWSQLTSPLVWDQGVLRLDQPLTQERPQGFYRVIEQP